MPGTLAIFGAGYGWDALSRARWLAQCSIHYWGDIDTWGLTMLTRARQALPGLTALLIIQMFPQMLAFVAIFLLLLTIGDIFPVLGIGSLLGLIAVYLGGALGANTFLMYGFFNTIPDDLDEAAKIDGATHAQIFWGMIMRLVTPILAVVALLAFISSFGDYIISKIILGNVFV